MNLLGKKNIETESKEPIKQAPQDSLKEKSQEKPPSEMVQIKSIGIWSLAKFQGVVMTVVGIIMSAIYWIVGNIVNKQYIQAINMPQVQSTVGNPLPILLTAPNTTVAILIIVVMAILGLITGAVIAIVYNLISMAIGGIEVEFK